MPPVSPSGRCVSGGTIATFGAALILLGVAAVAWRQGQVARAALATSEIQYERQVGDLRVASRRLRQADQRRGELHGRTPAPAPPDPVTPGATQNSGDGSSRERAAGQKFLAAFPRARELLLGTGRTQFELIYAPLLRSGALSTVQVQQLEDSTVANWLQTIAIAPQGGLHADSLLPPDDQVKGILGDAGFQQWQDYNRTLPAQVVVRQAATGAGFADAPLSDNQADQLAKIVTAASPAYQDGKRIALGEEDWDAALSALRANGSFSPAQEQAAERVFLTRQCQASLGQAQRAAMAAR